MRRRALLATAIGSSGVLAGCLDRSGEGTTVEIIPRNHTDEEVTLSVAVYARDGTLLLDHSFTLQAGTSDESRGVDNRVDSLVVSRAGHDDVRHDYAPDIDSCARDGEDVQILINPDGITFAYAC
jgi:hypothetical protein